MFTNNLEQYSNYNIGDFTYGKPIFVHFGGDPFASIGKFCSIASNVRIMDGGNHYASWISTYPFSLFLRERERERERERAGASKNLQENLYYRYSKGKVKIGNDVWIGRDVLILSGITVGDGAVIGAGSVVTNNVKPYEVVGGNPARHIKYRFSSDQIQELVKISWWNWELEKIEKHVELLASDNIEDFLCEVDPKRKNNKENGIFSFFKRLFMY